MTAYMTTQEILARAQRTADADAKAADPASVTDEDLKHMSPDTLRTLMNEGKLSHLGIGGRRRPLQGR